MYGPCADCGVTRDLHKHHLIPRSDGGTDEASNLVGLCSNCHEDRHGGPVGGRLRGRNKHSTEAKAKRGAAMRTRWADPESRERMMAALYSPEARAKRTETIRQWYADPANAERVAAIQRANASKPDRNAKISATLKEKGIKPPENPDAIYIALLTSQTPEAKAKRAATSRAHHGNSEALKARWADPEFRAKMSIAASAGQRRRYAKGKEA